MGRSVTTKDIPTMHKRVKITLLVLTAALALGAAVGNATARRLEVSEQRILVLFRALSFGQPGQEPTSICDVNIEGSFHSRTLSKVSGQLIGYITEAVVHRPCVRGAAWILNGVERLANGSTTPNSLPWHIRYDHFEGTLPRITIIDLQLIGAQFLVESLGLSCLYTSTAANPMVGLAIIEDGTAGHPVGQVTGLRAKEEFLILISAGQSIFCPREGQLRGTGQVGTQTEWRLIFIRLVQ
jgi:hypothetical protein